MIDKKTAIEELNSKICFINEKYADSDIPINKLLEDYDHDICSTEGEIAALLEYDPLAQLAYELENVSTNLQAEARANVTVLDSLFKNGIIAGKQQMLEKVQKLASDLKNKEPVEIHRDKITEAEKYLAAIIADENEVQNVLQTIIETVFDVEIYSNRPQFVSRIIDAM